MINQRIPEYFEKIFTVTTAVKNNEEATYRQALVQTLATLIAGELSQADIEQLSSDSQTALSDLQTVDWSSLSFSDRRNILQLLVLKADREDKTPANQQLTPDGIGYLLGELIYQTTQIKEDARVTDMVVGTGNLLWTVEETLNRHELKMIGTGIDNDNQQLALASVTGEALHDQESALFLGDVVDLAADAITPAPIVIGDLPIGYYPQAAPTGFVTSLSSEAGKSYAHYLMIEKSLDLVSDDGWIYLVVPADLLAGPNHEAILKLLSQKAQLKAFLALPSEYFKNQERAKALLVLRKPGVGPKTEVLMGQYPSVKDPQALQEFLQDIAAWGKLK
ncbi:class I SAM-dependent methyltransferase [Fructobacillus ficulneus]|uniref:Adenine-specific methyltransferase n=1 Tax=Fructobacillus ficulneus TaxID=157463 RepID=A0A0K8MGB9_9LACO|nr:class I SAM-dependent methyltransferase [Fructobacillus ficulneus]GAO99570.1 adenine-specific methyltransferase [Fructobacillus ficulneus]